jgi:hypothetical protein
VWPKAPEVLFENVVEMVFRRTPLRARLGLLAANCDAKRPNRECCCLSDEALDDVGDQVTNKKAVLAAARKHHVRLAPAETDFPDAAGTGTRSRVATANTEDR